jgi:hypothetical protein
MDACGPAAGRAGKGFDFTGQVRRLCADMAARLPELAHVDLDRVAIRSCQTRKHGIYGIHASLTPLRFAAGALVTERRGRRWTIQRVVDQQGREMLYLLSFYLPRFQNLPYDEKLCTVLHELWHIGPDFDGDLRRHQGRCYAHSASQRNFDEQMRQLAARYLAADPPAALLAFLHYSFLDLEAIWGTVYGAKLRTPKLIPLAEAKCQAG